MSERKQYLRREIQKLNKERERLAGLLENLSTHVADLEERLAALVLAETLLETGRVRDILDAEEIVDRVLTSGCRLSPA
jgi:predicted  nucleic acid-binding Zn-ribbon protein